MLMILLIHCTSVSVDDYAAVEVNNAVDITDANLILLVLLLLLLILNNTTVSCNIIAVASESASAAISSATQHPSIIRLCVPSQHPLCLTHSFIVAIHALSFLHFFFILLCGFYEKRNE